MISLRVNTVKRWVAFNVRAETLIGC